MKIIDIALQPRQNDTHLRLVIVTEDGLFHFCKMPDIGAEAFNLALVFNSFKDKILAKENS